MILDAILWVVLAAAVAELVKEIECKRYWKTQAEERQRRLDEAIAALDRVDDSLRSLHEELSDYRRSVGGAPAARASRPPGAV